MHTPEFPNPCKGFLPLMHLLGQSSLQLPIIPSQPHPSAHHAPSFPACSPGPCPEPALQLKLPGPITSHSCSFSGRLQQLPQNPAVERDGGEASYRRNHRPREAVGLSRVRQQMVREGPRPQALSPEHVFLCVVGTHVCQCVVDASTLWVAPRIESKK